MGFEQLYDMKVRTILQSQQVFHLLFPTPNAKMRQVLCRLSRGMLAHWLMETRPIFQLLKTFKIIWSNLPSMGHPCLLIGITQLFSLLKPRIQVSLLTITLSNSMERLILYLPSFFFIQLMEVDLY